MLIEHLTSIMSKEGVVGRGGGGGGRGEWKGETAPCHKGMGPRLNLATNVAVAVAVAAAIAVVIQYINEQLFLNRQLDWGCANLSETNGHQGVVGLEDGHELNFNMCKQKMEVEIWDQLVCRHATVVHCHMLGGRIVSTLWGKSYVGMQLSYTVVHM